MKKYILLFCCTFLLSTLLYGCSSNTQEITHYETPLYSITAKDGHYNLLPKATQSNVDDNVDASIKFFYPEFQSVKEMHQAIITGSFTELELYALSYDGGEIEICDPNHLYECTAPADISLEKIVWQGIFYDFNFSEGGFLRCYREKEYTESFNKNYKYFLSSERSLVTLTKQEVIEERSATVYYAHSRVAKTKYICYEICVGNKKMFVQEEYVLEIDNDLLKESSEVPIQIEVWGTENGGYFYGLWTEPAERPSVEWLCEFGITPYAAPNT